MSGIDLEVMLARFEAMEQVKLSERQCIELQCALTDGAFVYHQSFSGVF